jgi:formylglycine-generating enzyme required for sulfatase activity
VVDPCKSVICETPPAPICKDPATLTTYAKTGTCKAGSCGYTPQDKACAFGCEQGACKADPCATITCNQPPAAICKDADTKTTYAAKGTCTDGNCGYVASDADCAFGCENGACKADPCAAVTCNQPPTATCKDEDTKTTYPAKGTCSDGSCSYAPTDTACGKNQLCGGAGLCSVCSSDDSCGQNCTACQGATPKCKLSGLASKCVACISDADCGGANPKCNTATNVCGPQPSCMGLAKTCGPAGDQDCCAAGLVMGGSYNRSNDPKYPATVSDFRLDNYEITVGRFRKFVAVYQQDIIAAGAGRNPNNPSDTGWDGDLNFDMPKDKAALTTSLKCNGGVDVWQDSVGTAESESLPLPCMSWLVAQAFCIWDGGRLPTEAEWGYAAAGGNQQRLYPWGNAFPDCSYANSGAAPCGDNVNRVGSESPLGDGLFGQSDLAGNLREWVQDWYESPYTSSTCNNCAELSWSYQRVVLGGSFVDDLSLESGFPNRGNTSPYFGISTLGARCARMP